MRERESEGEHALPSVGSLQKPTITRIGLSEELKPGLPDRWWEFNYWRQYLLLPGALISKETRIGSRPSRRTQVLQYKTRATKVVLQPWPHAHMFLNPWILHTNDAVWAISQRHAHKKSKNSRVYKCYKCYQGPDFTSNMCHYMDTHHKLGRQHNLSQCDLMSIT